tara:strand:+ start:1303 stop:1713 length:411 start_codon:yes stop_codon:yes gene_type:complete
MGKIFCFKSPTLVMLPRKTKKDKTVYLNLNCYRNLSWSDNNNSKKLYKKIMQEQLDRCPTFSRPVTIKFKLIKNSKRKTDKHNFYSVIAKYLYDALTENGNWIDDNDDIIKTEIIEETEYKKGKENLVLITISEIY